MINKNRLVKAQLTWDEQSHPYSSNFEDHYYSIVDGLEESRHVFINGNNLLSRWKQLDEHQTFSIMETGFGSGLNFLATWQLWNGLGLNSGEKLHYYSIEAFPMDMEQLAKSLAHWKPLLPSITDKLLEKYPPLNKGMHTINFEQNNITLTLIFEDVRSILPTLDNHSIKSVDAWFLDGFAPSKNPEMWSDDLYKQMLRLSNDYASVATYTVAGIVRRGLTAAGFTIAKKPGFGTKREMLTASNNTSKSKCD